MHVVTLHGCIKFICHDSSDCICCNAKFDYRIEGINVRSVLMNQNSMQLLLS